MKPSPTTLLEPALYTTIQDAASGEHCNNRLVDPDDLTPSTRAAENDSVKELLKKILDVLKTRVHNDEEQSHEADKEDGIKRDWMLAAAVLDRICAIAFTIVFIGGTLASIVLFVARP